jgi:hypothetical protein
MVMRDFDDEARENEVLLDLITVGPTHRSAPVGEVGW